jgi:hypothetical protein
LLILSKKRIGVMIERYLADLQESICPEIEDALFADWLDFIEGRFEGKVFSPRRRRATPGRIEWPKVSINAALDDYDAMLLQQFGGCARELASGSGEFMCVRANYGTSIIPSLFGVELFIMDEALNTLPTSWPLGSEDRIRALLDRGVPSLDGGYGPKVFEMARRFAAIRAQYPKIGRYVHPYHPDFQGPLDLCELLWGCGIMTAFYETPELVTALLELVTATYIRFLRAWEAIVPFENGHAVHWAWLHKGHIMLRNDSAMNLSPALYETFSKPYDQRLLDEFGGGAAHFCGRGDHFIERLSGCRGLYAVNLSQPEYNDMETIFLNTVDKGIKVLALRGTAVSDALRRGRDLRGLVHCSDTLPGGL